MTEKPDYRNHHHFLGLEDDASQPESSWAWVLPLPLDMTTTFIGGTRHGPDAIIEASNQVELYDSDLGCEAGPVYGVYTLPSLHPTFESPQAAVASITAAVSELAIQDKILVTLGGEHSITPGIVKVFAERNPGLMVVQIDAHSDLRDSFDGTPYSHACAARRFIDYAPVLQFGIRSVCQEEVEFARESDRVTIFTAESMFRDRDRSYLERLKTAIAGHPIYLTIDLDGLDPSIIPATGTPEPGGIGWYDCLDLIQTVAQTSSVIAFDCVELCPLPGSHGSAFAAAKLIYKTLNYIWKYSEQKSEAGPGA